MPVNLKERDLGFSESHVSFWEMAGSSHISLIFSKMEDAANLRCEH